MKKSFILIMSVILLATFGFAQDKNYKMFETQYIKPKNDKLKEFAEAMTNHNKKFHNSGPYKASVWMANTGPYTGQLAWVMGPCTFTDLDSRPDSKEHNDDWLFNVMPYVESVSDGEYWKMDDKVSWSPEGSFSGKEVWSVYNIKPMEGYRFTALLEKVVDVYRKKNYPNYFEVYRNQFESDKGRDVAIGFGFKNYAFFDQDDHFWKDYEEINGDGSKMKFMQEYKDIVISAYDELSEYIPSMSGGTDKK